MGCQMVSAILTYTAVLIKLQQTQPPARNSPNSAAALGLLFNGTLSLE